MRLLESQMTKDSSRAEAQNRLGIKNRLALMGQGALGALIGTICCLTPAVAIAIGLGGGFAAALVGLGRFRLYGLVLGLGWVGLRSWLYLRRSRSRFTEEEYKHRQVAIPLTILASFGAAYGLVMYVILPLLYRIG